MSVPDLRWRISICTAIATDCFSDEFSKSSSGLFPEHYGTLVGTFLLGFKMINW